MLSLVQCVCTGQCLIKSITQDKCCKGYLSAGCAAARAAGYERGWVSVSGGCSQRCQMSVQPGSASALSL